MFKTLQVQQIRLACVRIWACLNNAALAVWSHLRSHRLDRDGVFV